MNSSGNFMKIEDNEIYYEKIGNGNNYLLLIPGALSKSINHLINYQLITLIT